MSNDLGGDYELLDENGNLIVTTGDFGYGLNAGQKSHRFDIVPFADTIKDKGESVTASISMPEGTPYASNVIAIGSDYLHITDNTVIKPCVCSCSGSGSSNSGGSSVGVNSVAGNAGIGDSENNVMHYSNFASGKTVIVAESALTTVNAETPPSSITKVKAELTKVGTTLATPLTVWYDADGAPETVYSFAFLADTSGLSTGMHDWEVELTEYYADDTDTSANPKTLTGTVSVINTKSDTSNPIGNGWFVFGVPSLNLSDSNHPILLRSGLQRFETDPAGGWRQEGFHDTSDYRLVKEWNTQDGVYYYYLTTKNGTIEKFTNSGQIISKTDPNGNVTSYTFTSGKLTSVQEPGGRTTTYEYTNDLLTKVTDSEGRETTYAHDATKKYITSMTKPDPDGTGPLPAPVTTFEYSDLTINEGTSYEKTYENLLTKTIGPDGGVTEIEYDYAGLVKKVAYPDGSVDEYVSYNSSLLSYLGTGENYYANPPVAFATLIPLSDGKVTVTSNGTTTTSEVDGWGFPVQNTDPDGNETIYIRNGAGQVTQIIEPDPDGVSGPETSAVPLLLHKRELAH